MKARPVPCDRLYPVGLPAVIAGVASVLLSPGVWAMDVLLSAYLLTTPERQGRTALLRLWTCLKIGAVLAMFLVCTPVSIIGAILRMISGPFRRPFLYQTVSSSTDTRTANETDPADFTVATANVCLLPESLSRLNNLRHTEWRVTEVGRRVVDSQKQQSDKRTLETSSHSPNEEFLSSVDSTFPPNVDIFCFQEVFYSDASRRLTKELLKCYGHVISDVGICSFTNKWGLNSGLLIASKHPILAADFKPFRVKTKQDVVVAKGLLMVKGRSLSRQLNSL
ncbi:sphingomyelin phosphodiesterase 5-like [Branchiostoma lanceolatum]|uniref:sphingomyelin phosphodiesterase 5-like n=1 Tax=Branchiostoma lanceolatum TaxID=7740 RepID=UPI0034569F46